MQQPCLHASKVISYCLGLHPAHRAAIAASFPEVSLNCSKGELYPETFTCVAARCVNVVDTPYALAPTGGFGIVPVRCALPCAEPEGARGWEYLVGYDEVADVQAPFRAGETAPAPAPPLPAGTLDASLPQGWCSPRCGSFTVAYAETTPSLERIARGLFSHLPCIKVVSWRSSSALSHGTTMQSALAQVDLLVTSLSDLDGLPKDELDAAGFTGVVVLIDMGCVGHTAQGGRPQALSSWEGRSLCVGADRKAASRWCGSFLEVPPGAMEVAMNCPGALEQCLMPLRVSHRQAEGLDTFKRRKLIAYLDDDCDPSAEEFFDSVAEDPAVYRYGAVEALGKCHGSHPELQLDVREGNLTSELANYMFVMAFEKSAQSSRQCPRYVTSTALEGMLRGTIPVFLAPDEGFSLLNEAAIVLIPKTAPLQSWKWALRIAVEDDAGVLARLAAPPLRPAARERFFSWDTALRGVRTDLAREAVALADAILGGSPHRRCVDLDKVRPTVGQLKVTV